MGPSPDALALLERPGMSRALVRRLVSPFPALVLFSVIVLATHQPPIVDTLMAAQAGSMGIDLLWIGAGIAYWWPVIRDVPRQPRFGYPVKMGYVILGIMFSPIMFGLVGFLVAANTPLYGVFELAPPIPGVSAHADHQLAGTLMSVGGTLVAFIAISVIFFRWNRSPAAASHSTAAQSSARTLRRLCVDPPSAMFVFARYSMFVGSPALDHTPR
jgi:cytochrome c oxidase assembly factor CtaG